MCFRVHGEARSASVHSAIESCGGTVEDKDEEERVDFVIVRLVSQVRFSLITFITLLTLTRGEVVASYLWTRQIPLTLTCK
jgi:hypothetical protein